MPEAKYMRRIRHFNGYIPFLRGRLYCVAGVIGLIHIKLLPRPQIIEMELIFHRNTVRAFPDGKNCSRVALLLNVRTKEDRKEQLHY